MSIILNGSTQYAYILEALAIGRPLTIAGWFKTSSDSAPQAIASLADKDSDVNYRILGLGGHLAGDPAIAQERDSSFNGTPETTTGYSTGTWHHALADFVNANSRKIIIDGGDEGTNSTSVSPANLDKTAIGVICRSSLAWFFAGKIAEVAIWDAILTPQNKTALANGADPSTIDPTNLLAYWSCRSNVNDGSGNNKHLTTVGSPSFDTEDHPEIGAEFLAGSSDGQATVPDAKLTRFNTRLAGSSAGQSTASGTLNEAAIKLIGSSDGQATVPDAKLTRFNTRLAGSSAGQSEVSGNIFVELATKLLFWRPESKIKESLVWKTDILRTHKGIEQRIKLRQTPRQLFRLQLVLDTEKINSWFDSILHTWQKKAWKIPIWTEYTIHTENINENDTVIYLDTKFADYRNNSYAVIWKSSSEYEIVFIDTKTTSQLNLKFDIQHSFTGVKYIMPCRIAYMVSTNKRQKYNSSVSIMDTVFAVYDNADISGYTPEMIYDDLDVLILPSYMDETHREESNGQIEINDFQTGIFKVRSDKEYNLLSQNHIFYNDTKEICWRYRQLLHSLNGRQKAILIPTFQNDLNLVDVIAPADEFLNVENIKLTINMGFNTLRTYIGFYFLNKTLFIRKITNIEEIDSTKEKISINTSLGVTVNPGDCKICFVDKCRLTSDKIEINWLFTHRNESKTNLMRVP